MQRKKIAIIGAGISGLSASWYLRRTGLPLDIHLFEKSMRVGGWIHTDYTTGFLFEKGPRTFKVDKSPAMMKLVAELGLEGELIWSEMKPHHRYLWHDGELCRFPTNLLSFLVSPLTRGFIRALFTEWKQPVKPTDETVWEFVLRRFNYDVARLFFDPLVVGIFGGDIRKISVRACFPLLKQWEEESGSVTRGFLRYMIQKRRHAKYSQDVKGVPLSAIFSFKRGMEQFSQELLSRAAVEPHLGHTVQHFEHKGGQAVIHTDQGIFHADAVFCALPVRETGQLLQPHNPKIAAELLRVPSQGLTVVSVGYEDRVLPLEGFGYLTSTYANEDILGVVFDSSIFIEHNRTQKETRLTIKIEDRGQSEEDAISVALKGIRRHLGISRTPSAISFKRALAAIPQYGVGMLEKMGDLTCQLRREMPWLHLVGNYIEGVSVDHCIARSKKAVAEFQALRGR
jgi:oxygen-dependent protoporphyrinogen oxidase